MAQLKDLKLKKGSAPKGDYAKKLAEESTKKMMEGYEQAQAEEARKAPKVYDKDKGIAYPDGDDALNDL